MPSSTSNSSERAPTTRWRQTWILALVLAVGGLVGLEGLTRARGWTPSYSDTVRLWSYWRAQVYAPKTVVLTGSSRTSMGLDPDSLSEGAPGYRFVNLAIIGSGSPVELLEDLADDDNFTGRVVFEVYPSPFFSDGPTVDLGVAMAKTHVGTHNGRAFIDGLESELRLGVQGNLAILRPEMRLTNMVYSVAAKRRLPKLAWFRVQRNRFQAADFARQDTPAKPWQIQPEFFLDAAARQKRYARVNTLVKRIQARGGAVLFFRMVSSGYVRDLEQQHLPRATYWAELVAAVQAPTLHFEDELTLRDYECPDGRHLDQKDARPFSKALAGVLSRRGWLP